MHSPFKRIVWPLAIAQTLLWAGCFRRCSRPGKRTSVFQGATLRCPDGGPTDCPVLAPPAGRAIDDGRGRALFAGATLAGALLLSLLSQVETLWQFNAVWVGLGIVMAGAFYEHSVADPDAIAGILCTGQRPLHGAIEVVTFPLVLYAVTFSAWRDDASR